MELLLEDAVVTMAGDNRPSRSMLVRDDRIAAVGSAEEVRAAAVPDAQAVPLDGATVIPWLIGAHCHLMDVGYLATGYRLQPAAGARHPGDPGAAAGGRRPDPGRLVGHRARVRGVQAPRGPTPHPRRPPRRRAGPPGDPAAAPRPFTEDTRSRRTGGGSCISRRTN